MDQRRHHPQFPNQRLSIIADYVNLSCLRTASTFSSAIVELLEPDSMAPRPPQTRKKHDPKDPHARCCVRACECRWFAIESKVVSPDPTGYTIEKLAGEMVSELRHHCCDADTGDFTQTECNTGTVLCGQDRLKPGAVPSRCARYAAAPLSPAGRARYTYLA